MIYDDAALKRIVDNGPSMGREAPLAEALLIQREITRDLARKIEALEAANLEHEHVWVTMPLTHCQKCKVIRKGK